LKNKFVLTFLESKFLTEDFNRFTLSFPNNNFKKYNLFVYNLNKHWMLLVVNFIEKKFFFYDSMKHLSKEIDNMIKPLKEFLKIRYFHFFKKDMDFNYEIIKKDCPQQKDCNNCGLYLIFFIENIIAFKEFDNLPEIKNEELINKRKEILKNILYIKNNN